MARDAALPIDPLEPEPEPSGNILIDARGITRVYTKGNVEVHALRGVDLTVREGEFLAIMGASGSGKTTLMHILGCLDRPSDGSYTLDGIRVDSLADDALSRIRNQKVSFVFQSFNLLSDSTVVENVGLPLVYSGIPVAERRERSAQAARVLGLDERLDHKPTELSGGQIQRVAIARALVNQSRIIMADEPTGNLDSKTGEEIFSIFEQLHREGKTIILVTHDARLARFADRIIHIGDGRIIREEIVERPNTAGSAGESLVSRLHKSASQPRPLQWRDIIRIGINEGLLAHKMRTFLTMLGIIFGVSAVIAMSAIGEGARQEAIEQIRQLGVNNVRVRALQLKGDELKEARRKLSDGLTWGDARALKEVIPLVADSVPVKFLESDVRLGARKPASPRIIATTPGYEDTANFRVEKGRFLNDLDLEYSRPVCVLGKAVKQDLFANEEAIDKSIRIGLAWYQVVGIMEGKNIPSGRIRAVSNIDLNHDIYIPLTAALKRVKQDKEKSEIDEISIRIGADGRVREAAEIIQRVIDRRHHQVADYELVVPEELLRREQATQRIFNIVMGCIAGISLLVGGIGIMNIMLATVTERTKEIGTRRAVGACQRDILKQFLVESVGIAVAGGIIGIALGWGIGEIIALAAKWKTVVSLTAMLLGSGVSGLVGILFGLYPAYQAAKKDPVEALRFE